MSEKKTIKEMQDIITPIVKGFYVNCTDGDCGRCITKKLENECHAERKSKEIAKTVIGNGYRKESDTVKEVLEKVLSFAAEYEVGLKWLIRKTAREYGVELSEK